MSLSVVEYPASVLSKPARRIDSANSLDLHALFDQMLATMQEYRGVGLAAPQVGKSIRFMLVHNTIEGETFGFANPQIIEASIEKDICSEGCLSFPGMYGDVERHLTIKLRFQDLDLVQHEEVFEGFFARVIQHELDHLNGVLLVDRAVDGLYEAEPEDDQESDGTEGGSMAEKPIALSPEDS